MKLFEIKNKNGSKINYDENNIFYNYDFDLN